MTELPKTRVAHCTKEAFDEYIGRKNVRFPKGSIWGNPFEIGRDGSRADVIAKFRAWLPQQPHLMSRLEELRGKALGCWCRCSTDPDGDACHGDFYVELLEGPPRKEEQFTLFE